MTQQADANDFVVEKSQAGLRLDAVLRKQMGEVPWSRVRQLIQTGKVLVDDTAQTDPGAKVRHSQHIEIRMDAPRPGTRTRLSSTAIAYVDTHVVVVRKPPGISTIPFDPGERGTLQELVRAWLNRTAQDRGDRATGDLGVVHRLDKETSGLLVFTRSLLAKRHLTQQMRVHSVERRYFAIVHGHAKTQTIRSRIVADRGDGIRGSTRFPNAGQEAITHVECVEVFENACLVRCTLETGRTHQVRIHLAEAGNPLLGERVYIRNFTSPPLPAPRVMLHATILAFDHPATDTRVLFEEPIPADMAQVIQRLKKQAPS